MAHAFSIPFMRRRNADGSWDSICTCCFLTVANRKEQAELEAVENSHNCSRLASQREEAYRPRNSQSSSQEQ